MAKKNKYYTNKDIAKKIAGELKIENDLAVKIIAAYFAEIKKSLLAGKSVRLAGFGKFDITKWKMNSLYDVNNKTKVSREIKTALFSPSEQLKKAALEEN